ncbi:MAG: transcription termination/antitermination protein NusG [Vicingaceae bacterium]
MSETTTDKKWYVIRAISGKEKKVKMLLEDEISHSGLKDYVSQILIPTEKVFQIRNGKKVSKERNFFPGYVLVEANLVGEVPHIIQKTTDVIGFLGAEKGGEPMPLRPSEVNRILGKVDELAESEEEFDIPFMVGEAVKVIDGPFNGFSGNIEEVNKEKKKLKVMVKIFGRKTPLDLSYMQVEKES